MALTKPGSLEHGYADLRIARGIAPKYKAIAHEIESLEAVIFQVPRVDDIVGQDPVCRRVAPQDATGTSLLTLRVHYGFMSKKRSRVVSLRRAAMKMRS